MKNYFHLRYKMICRSMKDNGLNPIVGFIISIVLFIAISKLIFYKVEEVYAGYIYGLLAMFFILKQGESNKCEFVKYCYNKPRYSAIRIIENLITAIPFTLFLIYKMQLIVMAVVILLSIILAFLPYRGVYSLVIPTPFGGKPFEFCVKFRTTFFLFPCIYYMAVMSPLHDNFALGCVSLALIYLILQSYYDKQENDFYIWTSNSSPHRFLFNKFCIAWLYGFIVASPIFTIMALSYPSKILITCLIVLIGSLYVSAMICAKYCYFTDKHSDIAKSIIYTIVMIVPPIITLPILFFTAIDKLKNRLQYDYDNRTL